MIFLTHFNLHAQYEKFINGEEMIMPNVTYCEDNDEVHYNSLKIIVKVSCVDASNGEELEGPHVSILDANKTIVEEWDSITEPHTIEGLKPGGTYTLRANMTSEGYTTTTETSFSINNDGGVSSTGPTSTDSDGNTILLVEIQMIQVPQVTASCTDIASGEELEGSHIQVIDSTGVVVDEWDSTKEPHQIENLNIDNEYTLHNTVASDGYKVASDTTFSIDNTGEVTTTGNTTTDENGNTVLLVEMEMTHVEISCVDITSGEELEGSHIQVLYSTGNVAEEWDSTTEAHVIDGLYVGETYTLRNTVASEGYCQATDTTFTIDETGRVTSTGTITVDGILLVEMQITQVQISCVDIADGEELEGSHIQVIDSEGNIAEEWDSTTEAHTINGLKTGEEYTLRNTVAPDGYCITTDTTFTINETGEVTSTGSTTEDGILLVEIAKTQVQVLCVDIADGAEVEGSTIQILDSEGNTVEEWTSTTEAHTIEGLNVGEIYTLRTTVASDGYFIIADTTFSMDETGEITTTGNITEDGILLVEIQKTKVKISCVDVTNGDELGGSRIQVIDSEGNVAEVWTSETEPHQIEGLNIGEEYTLRTTMVSDGFVIPTDITFSIDETGNVTTTGSTTTDENGNTVILIEFEKAQIQISCVDVANGAELEGAHIEILDEDGNVAVDFDSTDTAYQIEDLNTGIEYTLRTTVAPDGYTLATDTTFTINEAGHVTGTTFVTTDENGNTVILIELAKTIVKISSVDVGDGEKVEGAHIQVLDPDMVVVEEWDSRTEPHTIEGLNIETTYTLRVTHVPEPYSNIIPDETFTIEETGRITYTGTTTTDEHGNTVMLVEFTRVDTHVNP